MFEKLNCIPKYLPLYKCGHMIYENLAVYLRVSGLFFQTALSSFIIKYSGSKFVCTV